MPQNICRCEFGLNIRPRILQQKRRCLCFPLSQRRTTAGIIRWSYRTTSTPTAPTSCDKSPAPAILQTTRLMPPTPNWAGCRRVGDPSAELANSARCATRQQCAASREPRRLDQKAFDSQIERVPRRLRSRAHNSPLAAFDRRLASRGEAARTNQTRPGWLWRCRRRSGRYWNDDPSASPHGFACARQSVRRSQNPPYQPISCRATSGIHALEYIPAATSMMDLS